MSRISVVCHKCKRTGFYNKDWAFRIDWNEKGVLTNCEYECPDCLQKPDEQREKDRRKKNKAKFRGFQIKDDKETAEETE